MSPVVPRGTIAVRGFPRVSGDEPTYGPGPIYVASFSPRERG